MSEDEQIARFDLSTFSGHGYNKGRGRGWQVAWMIVQGMVFKRSWLPLAARAALLRVFGARIGRNVHVRNDVTVHWPWKLSVGDNSWIGVGAWILNLEQVSIGANSCISQQALLCTGSHDQRSSSFEFDNAPIAIGDGVWVGARATILRGVTISNNATVGACALVTRDVPAGAIVLSPSGR